MSISSVIIRSTSSMASSSSLSQIPAELFGDIRTFNQALSFEIWENCLSDPKRSEILNKHLPRTMSKEEKNETIQLLLNHEMNRFSEDPLHHVFMHLKLQRLAPDIAKTLEDVRILKHKAKRLKEEEIQIEIWDDVLKKRQHLFKQSLKCSASEPNYLLGNIKSFTSSPILKESRKSLVISSQNSTKKRSTNVQNRYKKELQALHDSLLLNPSSDSDDNAFDVSTVRENGKTSTSSRLKSSSNLKPKCNNVTSQLSEEKYSCLLKSYKRKREAVESKLEPLDSLMDTRNINLSDIISRVTRLPEQEIASLSNSKPLVVNNILKKVAVKKRLVPQLKLITNGVKSEPPSVIAIKEEHPPVTNTPNSFVSSPVLLSSLKEEQEEHFPKTNGTLISPSPVLPHIEFPELPETTVTSISIDQPAAISKPTVPIPSPAIEVITPSATKTEPSPTCFFSLLRDIFRVNAPNDNKLTLHRLEELVKDKLRCYDSKLAWNHEMVQSSMNYLSGALPPPEMIPLVDYKEKNQQWQWIGNGRDPDSVLLQLWNDWASDKDSHTSAGLMDPSQPIPPAICPTEWLVRPSNEDERKMYREQEAVRYRNPHKAFTFKIHSYQSVVGPVKGCGVGTTSTHAASPNKAREHSLLVSDRPPFVTLLSLVRDAAARLPNGEGTRADICELLKDSQYLLPTVSDQQVNGIVSGALDRLHYEKDPCVKYDVNRKVWIYLHRNRTEKEFERLHEMQVAAAKAKRTLSKTQRRGSATRLPSSSSKPLPPKISSNRAITTSNVIPKLTTISSLTAMPITTTTIDQITIKPMTQSPIMVTSVPALGLPAMNFDSEHDIKPASQLLNGSSTKQIFATTSQSLAATLLAKKKNSCNPIKINSKDSLSVEIAPAPSNGLQNRPIICGPALVPSLPQLDPTGVLKTSAMEKIIKPAVKPVQVKPNVTVISSKPQTVQLAPGGKFQQIVSSSIIQQGNVSDKITLEKLTHNQIQKQTIQIPAAQHQVSISTAGTVGTTQISIPNNLIIGGRAASVMLAGKQYMMATSGGSYMLQPQQTVIGNANMTAGTLAQGTPLAVRTLQGIKVIPVQGNPRVGGAVTLASQAQGTPTQLVARIISGRSGVQPTQIMIPSSSGFQPILVQQPNIPSTMVQSSPSITISVQPQHKVSTPQVASVTLPVQNPQKR
ncbi:Nuclear factor related to kappa-B-binding protein [Halotydeus destructor]|nr:Nuclear factor related to kappa-B-binding protein [Halotydeus destructor]